MRLRNEAQAWGAVSIALHWLTFVLVLGMALLGLNMTELPTGTFKVQVYALHKSLGLTILGLTALRLLWRAFASRPTPVPANVPKRAGPSMATSSRASSAPTASPRASNATRPHALRTKSDRSRTRPLYRSGVLPATRDSSKARVSATCRIAPAHVEGSVMK
jgi:hypothetical protein